jgi:hypothetical protein
MFFFIFDLDTAYKSCVYCFNLFSVQLFFVAVSTPSDTSNISAPSSSGLRNSRRKAAKKNTEVKDKSSSQGSSRSLRQPSQSKSTTDTRTPKRRPPSPSAETSVARVDRWRSFRVSPAAKRLNDEIGSPDISVASSPAASGGRSSCGPSVSQSQALLCTFRQEKGSFPIPVQIQLRIRICNKISIIFL